MCNHLRNDLYLCDCLDDGLRVIRSQRARRSPGYNTTAKKFRQHPIFSENPSSLQIMVYYDELELCNPLGSRRKKHKIGKMETYCAYMCIYSIYMHVC